MREISVTDHAVVRYLERVKGFDLSKARADITAIVAPAIAVGAAKISANGHTFVLRGYSVVSVIPGATPNGARAKTNKHRGKSVRIQRGK